MSTEAPPGPLTTKCKCLDSAEIKRLKDLLERVRYQAHQGQISVDPAAVLGRIAAQIDEAAR